MNKRSGFTIVELIVVIVVIAILAAITLVAYSLIQKRANDTRRISDIQSLNKSIKIYANEHGQLPEKTNGGNWSSSSKNPNGYIGNLTGDSAGMAKLPELLVDPVNSTTYYYRYYVYAAGNNSCDSLHGDFYVLQAVRFESGYGPSDPSPDSPGWSCPTRDWNTEAAYTVGGFLH